jgi:hypothetical protein
MLVAIVGLGVVEGQDASKSPAKKGKSEDAGLFADLTSRCRKMIELQSAAHEETKRLHKAIADNKKPPARDREALLKLTAQQDAVIKEVTAAIDRLDKDIAVAFPEIFNQLRDDMKEIRARLARNELGKKTQGIQRDVIENLRDMMGAARSR